MDKVDKVVSPWEGRLLVALILLSGDAVRPFGSVTVCACTTLNLHSLSATEDAHCLEQCTLQVAELSSCRRSTNGLTNRAARMGIDQ